MLLALNKETKKIIIHLSVTDLHALFLVSEPDPRKIEKEGLVNWLGWKCTLRLLHFQLAFD